MIENNNYSETIKLLTCLKMPKKLIVGNGSIEKIGEEAKILNGNKAFIITDENILKAGLVENVKSSLENEKIKFNLFYKIKKEPTIKSIEEAIANARKNNNDLIIGIGGGSIMDTAKVVACGLKNDAKIRDYIEKNIKIQQRLPLILVPTNAGTGAEVSSVSIFIDEKNNLKKTIRSNRMFSDLSIIDPILTKTLPPRLTACTGIDSLTHAIGCFISKKANPLTDAIAIEAIHLIGNNLRIAVRDGTNMKARYNMALGAALAMIARVNSGGGITHGLSYPIETKYHVPHCMAISFLLPFVISFNIESSVDKFIRIAEAMGDNVHGLSKNSAAKKAANSVFNLLKDIGISLGLKNIGVKKEDFPVFSDEVYQNSYRHVEVNPKKLSKEDLVKIYMSAF